MSRTHRAGSRKSSPCQSASQIVLGIAGVAGKMRTSQTENSFHLGRRYVDGQQFSREPQIDDAPVGLGKALPNVPELHPAVIDSDGSLGSNRGPWWPTRERWLAAIRAAVIVCRVTSCVGEGSKSWAALARTARASTIFTQGA
jgi:hypothetical protein